MQLKADYVVSAADVGLLKPHPRGLQRLMELAKTTLDETILIGDRAERDGEAARRAGLPTPLDRACRRRPNVQTL